MAADGPSVWQSCRLLLQAGSRSSTSTWPEKIPLIDHGNSYNLVLKFLLGGAWH